MKPSLKTEVQIYSQSLNTRIFLRPIVITGPYIKQWQCLYHLQGHFVGINAGKQRRPPMTWRSTKVYADQNR
jgi:hypothetical protein